MTENYYLHDFKDYAKIELDHATAFLQIGQFAKSLTDKANELCSRASAHDSINLVALEREMFLTGTEFIQEFTLKFRMMKLLSFLLLPLLAI